MRKIKFRAWNNKLEKMFYSDECYFVFQEGKLIERDGENSDYMLCRDDVVMQYTGLKDKNGKEIYEGDILKVKTYVSTRKGVVIFRKGQFAIKQDNNITFLLSDTYWEETERLKVIGNKYENPELLEVEE